MWKSNLAEVKRKLVEAGIATVESFSGCSQPEIDAIEVRFDLQLPPAYSQFLSEIGHRAGDFLAGIDYSYPNLLEFRSWMQELIDQCAISFSLAPTGYVFLSSQGYAFCFFYCNDNPDPPVYCLQEGEKQPQKIFDSFSDWLLAAVEDQVAIRNARQNLRKLRESRGRQPDQDS
jgi:hypothetical protein